MWTRHVPILMDLVHRVIELKSVLKSIVNLVKFGVKNCIRLNTLPLKYYFIHYLLFFCVLPIEFSASLLYTTTIKSLYLNQQNLNPTTTLTRSTTNVLLHHELRCFQHQRPAQQTNTTYQAKPINTNQTKNQHKPKSNKTTTIDH